MPERVGLFGWPVAHSISPAMHGAAFAALGLDWRYDLLPVPPGDLGGAVARRVEAGYRGFNVTIPHKGAALRLPQVHAVTATARAIGAANTLILMPEDGLLRADNTDAPGFIRDLEARGVAVRGARCLVLGTGGSARAVRVALAEHGAGPVTLVSRDPGGRPGVVSYHELAALASGVDLVVNCTPVGMSPRSDACPWPDAVPVPAGAVVYDLIYNPPVTRLVARGRAAGARAFNGLGMLVWQGALSFALWTGIMPPVEVMFAAARRALNVPDGE
jgi:shikimate dehydrogenase